MYIFYYFVCVYILLLYKYIYCKGITLQKLRRDLKISQSALEQENRFFKFIEREVFNICTKSIMNHSNVNNNDVNTNDDNASTLRYHDFSY